jgi:S-formylglutathione hydrolase FrmB
VFRASRKFPVKIKLASQFSVYVNVTIRIHEEKHPYYYSYVNVNLVKLIKSAFRNKAMYRLAVGRRGDGRSITTTF